MRRVFLVPIFRRAEEIWACCLFSGKHAGRRMSAGTVSAKPRRSGTAVAGEEMAGKCRENGWTRVPVARLGYKKVIFICWQRAK